MPLTSLQRDILRILAAGRSPESYVAGATPLNRSGYRFSGDIDIFHDREERVGATATADALTLAEAGYEIHWKRQEPAIHSAEVAREGERTLMEWVSDSDYRFFPTVPDELFGFVLHPVDLAMNKAMAAAGRRAVRDLVDLVTIHDTILPLGPVVWAAVEKAPGFTPQGVIAEIRRNSLYHADEWKALDSSVPIDPVAIIQRLRAFLDEAEAFCLRMPASKVGLLFLKNGTPVEPDPSRLDDYQTHAGMRRGHWPTSPEITTAMLERYRDQAKAE